MVVSLAVVTAVVWILLTVLYAYTEGLFKPRGFNVDNVYSMTVRMIEPSSPYYAETDNKVEAMHSDYATLLRRLERHPDVEAVACHWGALPYSFDFKGSFVEVPGEPDSVTYYANIREASAEIVRVMRLESLTGATSEQLEEMLRRGEVLISDSPYYSSKGRDPMALKGKKVFVEGDSSKTYRVGDVIRNVRRNDYEIMNQGTLIKPIPEEEKFGSVAVRVKPGRGAHFEKSFGEDPTLRRQRNVFLTEFMSMDSIRETNQHATEVNIRQMVVLALFTLLTVLLGLMGTFWFRVQQRVSEISVRMVFGARRSDVARRIITEGLTLLLIAVAVVSAVVLPTVAPWFVEESGQTWEVVLLSELAAVVAVAAGITLSLWYPARRAMAIEPAQGIKEE